MSATAHLSSLRHMTLALATIINMSMLFDKSYHIRASIDTTHGFDVNEYNRADSHFTAMLLATLFFLVMEIASTLFLSYELLPRHIVLTAWHFVLLSLASGLSLWMYIGEKHYHYYWYVLWCFHFPSFVLELLLNSFIVVTKVHQD